MRLFLTPLLAALAFGEDVISASPSATRALATKAPLPEYPAASVKANQTGRVVLGLEVTSKGDVDSVEPIEFQHALLAASAVTAVKTWKFRVEASLPPYRLQGRVVFYFRIRFGRAEVIDAANEYNLKVAEAGKVEGRGQKR